MTAFLYAIRHRGNSDAQILITHILKPLLGYDSSAFDQRDNRGRTALMLELRNSHPDATLLKFLISLSPAPEQYINVRDADGHSALMHAIGVDQGTRYNYRSPVDAVKFLLADPALDICLPDQMGRGILEVTCSMKWLYFGYTWEQDNAFFPILDAILQANDGWDVSVVRKAVIAAVREMQDPVVYRLLLEDWVTHSFAWTLDDTDTVTLLAQATTRRSSCRAPVSIVLCRLGLLEPSMLVGGISILNHRELIETFCRNQGRGDCRWHDKGIGHYFGKIFSNWRSYTPDELERMIPRTQHK